MVYHEGLGGYTTSSKPISSIQGLRLKFEQNGALEQEYTRQHPYKGPVIEGTYKFRKMAAKQESPGAKRSSFKYIQPNVVQRRTQLFEGSPEEDFSIMKELGKDEKVVSPDPSKPSWVGMRPSEMSPKKVRYQPKDIGAVKGSPRPGPEVPQKPADLPPSPKHRQSLAPDSKVSTLAASKTKLLRESGEEDGDSPPRDKPYKTDLPEAPPRRLGRPIKPERSVRPNKPPKPEFPSAAVKERLKSMSSSENVPISPKPTVEHGVLPTYAKVNKPKKVLNIDENTNPELTNITKHRKSNSYDGIVQLPEMADDAESSSEENVEGATGPPPPPKPPRTFAHDVYLKAKAQRKRDKKIKRTSCPSPVREAENGHIYEEVASPKLPVHDPRGSASSHTYEEVEEVKKKYEEGQEGGMKKLPEKPQPPPRPPQPTVRKLSRPDEPFVRVVKHNSSLTDDSFVSSKSIRNPGYMKPKTPDIIPIKTKMNGRTLQRSRSDECLYADADSMRVDISAEPIYQDPADVVHPGTHSYITPHGVVVDSEGYALPDTGRHTIGRAGRNIRDIRMRSQPKYATMGRESKFTKNWTHVSTRRKSVREKVSRAYSVLRVRRPPPDGTGTVEDSAMEPMSEDAEDDRDSEVDMEEHRKRLKYVSSIKERHSVKRKRFPVISSVVYNTLNWQKSIREKYPQLFEYTLVVGLQPQAEENRYKPKVLFKFPENAPGDMENIIQFCFPDAPIWRPVTQYNSESYCFVLTHADGSREYGFCRRILPPGSGNRLPEVYCIVSPLGAATFYEQLLDLAERKRGESLDHVECLLQAAYARPLPKPGKEICIRCLAGEEKNDHVTIVRSKDERLENVSHSALLSRLSLDVLLKVYGSILLERRILFTAQHLGTLSSCIQAISSLLFPFTWQHVYIPVLPTSLLDIVCSPTPYIIGILSTSVPALQKLPMEEVLIVDLDNNNLLESLGDEGTIIPKKVQKALTTALKDDSDASSRDTIVFEAFLRLFVETMGHYTDYIMTQQDGKDIFQKEFFCRAVSSKSIRMFLEWFIETQMFEVFMTDRLENGIPETGLFETRILEYRQEMNESNKFRENVKELGRKMLNFMVESGGKLKKAFAGNSNNVYV